MKSVFITGANRGLGKGFVEYFLNKKFLVFAGVRDPSGFDPKLKENPNLKMVAIELTSDDSIAEAASVVAYKTSSLDFLINNAGVNKDSATNNHKEKVTILSQLGRRELLTMFDINSVAPMIVIQKFLPLLTAKPSFVINISSGRASYNDEYENTTGNYGYRASKAALNLFTFCSLHDLPKNVKTFAVHPGGLKTDMNPDGTMLPIDQAEKIIAITKNWKEEFSGKFLRFDGTFYP